MSVEQSKIIPGYSHPKTQVSTRGRIYKTFTEGKKRKKKEKFGNTTVGREYKSSADFISQKEEVLICPTCSKEAIKVCPCGYSDRTCIEGHVWFLDRDGKTKLGNPH